MVSEYNNSTCKYSIDKLEKVVYLLNKEAIGSISIDNGAAFIASAASTLAFDCYSISLEENDTLDERYEFAHTLKFSVQGYINNDDLYSMYYAVIQDKDGTYWLINPVLPLKVTYTYTLDSNSNHTDFVISTKSNFPLLKVNSFVSNHVKTCKVYDLCGFDFFEINEKAYSKIDNNGVYYTNDGFKKVTYNKNSASFTESFDGNNVSHELKFNIGFDDYKSSWHYNLLEFSDNKYAVIIRTKCGTNIATGFGYGLQPSFIVTGSDSEFNRIEITLHDLHDKGDTIHLPSEVPYSELSATTWAFVPSEYECVSQTEAMYLLMREYDGFHNPLNNYKCFEGYEDRFEDLNIVGTFDNVVTFACDACRSTSCEFNTSISSSLTFLASGQCMTFSINSTSEWSVTNNESGITVNPMSGDSNTKLIEICNNYTPSESGDTHHISIDYCGDKTYDVSILVIQPSATDCLVNGQYYNIGPEAQYLNIPNYCCLLNVSADTNYISEIQIQKGYVRMYVSNNQESSAVTHTLTFKKCDGSTFNAYVVQSPLYSRWVKEDEVCNDGQKCDLERLYTGRYPDDINTPTTETRYTNCSASTDCQEVSRRWVESVYTTCNDEKLYAVEFMQIKYGDGDWTNTGVNRLGRQLEDVSGQCITRYEHWVETSGYTCNGTTKYKEERLYYSTTEDEPESAWTSTDVYRQGSTVIEYDSTDCGYSPAPSYTYEEWRIDGYVCDSYNKYLQERRYTSIDGNEWSASSVTRRGSLVEEKSADCGYEAPVSFKLKTTYSDSSTYSAECDTEITLTTADTRPSGYEYSAMTSANIGNCIEIIGKQAFAYCSSLSSCTIGNGVTSIGSSAFWYCNNLISIDIPSGVTSIGISAFNRCASLTSVNIPSGVTSIADFVFEFCSSLTSVTIPDDVTSIGQSAFQGCYSLISIDIPSGVTSIGQSAFENCSGLTSCTIGNSVTSIGSTAFQLCRSLTNIDIPNSVTSIGNWAFSICSSLSSVTIGSGVTSIGYGAFESCNGLTSITVNATTPPTLGTGALSSTNNCPIYVPAESVDTYKAASGWSEYSSRIQAIP